MSYIISGFPGVGKTTVSQKYANVLDLESSDFKWIYTDPKIQSMDKELRKGVDNKFLNPEWPNNYIDAIIKFSKDYEVIFISTGKDVRTALSDRGIKYDVCIPDKTDKQEFIERYIGRGNNDNFIKIIESNFEIWVDDLINERSKIILNNGEFLEEALLRIGYLRKENRKHSTNNSTNQLS